MLPRRAPAAGYAQVEEDALCTGSSGGESEHEPSLADQPVITNGTPNNIMPKDCIDYADTRLHLVMPQPARNTIALALPGGCRCVLPLTAPVHAGQSVSFSLPAISATATAQGLGDSEIAAIRDGSRFTILSDQ
jgi:hypothetical protein